MTSLPSPAVCSWSLRPTSPRDLVDKIRAAGLSRIQLAFRPFVEGAWRFEEARAAFAAAKIVVVSGMLEPLGEDYSTLESIRATGGVRPDATWEANLEIARRSTALALRFGVDLVTFHAGFIPESAGPEREVLCERLRNLHDLFASARVRLALETGQETAESLLHALDEIGRPSLGVNFDPANLILYGMGDPIEALRKLAHRVRQVHVKDARPASVAGTWGEEVPVGTGAVDWTEFFATLRDRGLAVPRVVEREAGEDRIGDVRTAVSLMKRVEGGLA